MELAANESLDFDPSIIRPRTEETTAGFDRLLAGVKLPSLEEGPLLELPPIHPLTGTRARSSLL